VPVDVTRLLTSLEARIKQAAGVACALDTSGGQILALADAGQLEQVVLAVASQDLESARERTRLSLKCSMEGEYACIALRDDGQGLDAAKQAAVFETGLTAKTGSTEAQSGLALAGAYSLVRQWGGDITFISQPGRGSEYRIYLRTPESHLAKRHVRSRRQARRAMILLVEDKPAFADS
jgi:signal transduction histidine kinase